uniref:Uncharacterized protein n=1 Tax=Oryza brachyantha TaxID=4533 RepID=J3L1G1_ORYBR
TRKVYRHCLLASISLRISSRESSTSRIRSWRDLVAGINMGVELPPLSPLTMLELDGREMEEEGGAEVLHRRE